VCPLLQAIASSPIRMSFPALLRPQKLDNITRSCLRTSLRHQRKRLI
jgi:hypothetical protein